MRVRDLVCFTMFCLPLLANVSTALSQIKETQYPPRLVGESEEKYVERIWKLTFRRNEERFVIRDPNAPPVKTLQIVPTNGDMSSLITTEEKLTAFYGIITSFVTAVKNEKRLSGLGWKIQKSDRTEWKVALDKALAKRDELMKEASSLGTSSPDEFWKKVFQAELDAEAVLGDMLSNVFPPHEMERFLVEHSRELGDCILTSTIFRDAASLESKQYASFQELKEKSFRFVLKSMTKTVDPSDRPSIKEFAIELRPDQFRTFLVMVGRMDSDETLDDFFARIPSQDRTRFLEAFPALRNPPQERKF